MDKDCDMKEINISDKHVSINSLTKEGYEPINNPQDIELSKQPDNSCILNIIITFAYSGMTLCIVALLAEILVLFYGNASTYAISAISVCYTLFVNSSECVYFSVIAAYFIDIKNKKTYIGQRYPILVFSFVMLIFSILSVIILWFVKINLCVKFIPDVVIFFVLIFYSGQGLIIGTVILCKNILN